MPFTTQDAYEARECGEPADKQAHAYQPCFETPEERADKYGTDPRDEEAADQDECDRAAGRA